jgi:hypothetical protein
MQTAINEHPNVSQNITMTENREYFSMMMVMMMMMMMMMMTMMMTTTHV